MNCVKDRETLDLSHYDCILFDCDGVLWHGDEVIPGAIELVEELTMTNKHVFFVTNASRRSREEMHAKFIKLGFTNVLLEQCYPSGFFCAEYLRLSVVSGEPELPVFVVGGAGLVTELEKQGFAVHTYKDLTG